MNLATRIHIIFSVVFVGTDCTLFREDPRAVKTDPRLRIMNFRVPAILLRLNDRSTLRLRRRTFCDPSVKMRGRTIQ